MTQILPLMETPRRDESAPWSRARADHAARLPHGRKIVALRWVMALSLLAFGASGARVAVAQTNEPLVQRENLVYLGAFRVPQGLRQPGTFSYGGTALALNPAHHSLYVVGHAWYQRTAEISIPAIVHSQVIGQLQTATLLQPFVDALEGRLAEINPTDPNTKRIGGELVYDGKLFLTAYSYYDGNVTQSSSHFVRPLDLATTGQLRGPIRVGNIYPGYVAGYMTVIPAEWQAAFGGPALTGNCCVPGGSWQSQGPAASVFDPTAVESMNPVPATPVLGYPLPHVLGPGAASTNPIYNMTARVTGVVFPPGTRSVLFFGRAGVGPYCYGRGTADSSLVHPQADPHDPWCFDPADSSKGTHSYPYVYQVWAYDANDLIAVKNGSMVRYAVRPYTIWTFTLPFENASDKHLIGGTAFDPATNDIYISQECEDADCTPIIHVLHYVAGGVPSPPSSVQVH